MGEGMIAVTGASGNVGGAVVGDLVDDGDREVVALVRDLSRLHDGGTHRVRVADYAQPAAMKAALEGVETLVFVSSDGETAPMLMHHCAVVRAARDAGVEHLVYLSIIDVERGSPFCYAAVHRETERLLRTSGVSHSVVRAGLYGEFFARWVVQAAKSGVLRLPVGSGQMSLVSRSDVARSLAAAARQAPSGPQLITGNNTYSLQQLAALTEQLAQTRVKPEDCDERAFGCELLQGGTSPWWAYAFTTMFQSVRDHRYELITGHLTQLTGRAPIPFDDIAAHALDAG
ncbi:MAG: NAD(P)H-binding protein [Nocardioidaceae bacterium]